MKTIYEAMTSKIVQALKDGTPPWRKPWAVGVGANSLPVNAASNRPYRGINVFSLWLSQEMHHYSSNLWGTKEMWTRLGGTVFKTSKPTDVYLFRRVRVRDPKSGRPKMITILNTFDVYNLDQVWGCIAIRQKVEPVITSEANINYGPAEEIAENMNVKTVHRGNKAAYNPDADKIVMPPKVRFKSQIGYWNTRFHELVHSTGHESRLKRQFGRIGSPEYAFEELIAEIGTAFVCSMIGLPDAQSQMPNHVSYLRSWLAFLQNDEKAIFRAASAAQKAADFVMTGGESAKPKRKKSPDKNMELQLAGE